jgi:thymidylate synthase
MNEVMVIGNSLPEAYHKALCALSEEGVVSGVPDYQTTQKELSMTMVVKSPLEEPMISRCFIGGARDLEQYRQEILDGILDSEIERGNWDYTYHSRMNEQMDFIVAELQRNPESRRAVIDVRDWKADIQKSSPACLQHIQYFIRGGKLHCKVLFRSNDAPKASFMNAFALIMLQKRFADRLGVEIGSYTHRANSYHVYERDYPMLAGYIGRIKSGSEVTYYYAGDWDAQMEDAKEEIAAFVRARKAAAKQPR